MGCHVLVDSDFFTMIAPCKNIDKEKEFVKSVFDSLNKKPCIHPFVAKEELFNNEVIKQLIDEGYITVIDYNSVLKESWMEQQYVDNFVTYYDYMNSEKIPSLSPEIKFSDIKRHHANKNMGEIHTLIFAHYLEIPLFMSNDKEAKKLAETKINSQHFSIDVKNVCDVFCMIKTSGSIKLDTKVVRSILKKREEWREQYRDC